MRNYSPNAPCPKCGHNEVGTFYCNDPGYGDICWVKEVEKEHLHRNCRRCFYEWFESCWIPSGGDSK